MDQIDQQIVALLRDNARRSFQDIGGHVSLSAPAVKRRVDRLQSDGLVETYHVESSAGPSRKYYRLTEAGKASFSSQKSAWSSFSGAVAGILGEVK